MKTIYILLIASIFSTTSFAQYFTIDTIKGESPYNKQVSFIFPHLSNTANQANADVINKELTKSILDVELGQQTRSIFEKVWGSQEMDIAALSDISFKVMNNDPDFFCISISATGCGAYCEAWTQYYTYESSSGRKVKLQDFFTSTGLQKISDSVKAMKARAIQDYTSKLKASLDKGALSPEDKADYAQAIELLNKCTDATIHQDALAYSFSNKVLTIHLDKCLPHAIRFLDKVDYSFSFDNNTYRDYLTDYGKSLLH